MTTLRKVREDEFDDLIALWQFAFQVQMPPERVEKERESFRTNHHWGLFDENGRLLTNLSILPFEVWVRGVRMKMGGIAGVSSWPDTRRQGGVTRLLRHALRIMREEGQTLSMLHPFSVPFYRKYGYELTVTRKLYTIETKHFPPRADVPGTVAIVPKQSELLNDVYERYAAKYSSTLARTDDWWERKVLSKPGVAALYRNPDGVAEGYLLYEAADRKMRIHEWVHTTEKARAALWSYISNHDSMIDQLVMTAPEDDDLPFYLPEPRVKQELVPYFMSRIVDVERFVGQYSFAASEQEDSLAIRVDDDQADWNNGWFRLTIPANGRQALIERTETAPTGIPAAVCDIRTWTAMLAGGRRPASFASAGRLQTDGEALAILERRIPHGPTYLADFF